MRTAANPTWTSFLKKCWRFGRETPGMKLRRPRAALWRKTRKSLIASGGTPCCYCWWWRLRIGAVLRGTAVFASVALAATVVLVLLANHFAFASWTLTSSRVVLLLSLALAIGFGLALPLYGLNPRRTASKAEGAFPQFEQRLVTYAERDPDKR